MKKTALLLAFIGLLTAGSAHAQEVLTAGMARNVMMGTDLSAKVALDSLITQPGLYALGPVDDLQGELLVLNGIPYAADVRKDAVRVYRAADAKAPFLAYSYVTRWHTIEVTQPLADLAALQAFVARAAQGYGIPEGTPFPFLLRGSVDSIDLHIIMRNPKERKHSHEAHNKAKRKFHLANSSGELLGFYSTQHEGVFTHKGQYMHLHFISDRKDMLGHVDGLSLQQPFQLLLPMLQY
jgi:acetolactate decarboxylase